MITFVTGTRPEIIKVAGILWELRERRIDTQHIHTGQHSDNRMAADLFEELDIEPTRRMGVGSADVTEFAAPLRRLILADDPSLVVVQGATRSAFAGALAAYESGIAVAHVEAGLRCHDFPMFEEQARVMIDAMSTLLFAPTPMAIHNLQTEIPDIGNPRPTLSTAAPLLHVGHMAFLTGNPVVDAMRYRGPFPLRDVHVAGLPTALVTIHRAENVMNDERFNTILDALREVDGMVSHIRWPLHPRIEEARGHALDDFDDWRTPPMSYQAFLRELAMASVVITDSGGVQEEAAILGVPTVTVRPSTERPETLAWGINRLAEPVDIPRVVSDILEATKNGQEWPKAGDAYGTAPSNKIAGIIERWEGARV